MEVKERPILYSPLMIQAINDRRKTMTRRIIKPQPGSYHDNSIIWRGKDPRSLGEKLAFSVPVIWQSGTTIHSWANRLCPYGKVGDRLWVREKFQLICGGNAGGKSHIQVRYLADDSHSLIEVEYPVLEKYASRILRRKTFPSIHMPRWASRILLEVTEVRIERLQDITEADSLAEGVISPKGSWFTAKYFFHKLWDDINGPGAWEKNPWVWVVVFKVVEIK